MAVQLDPSMFDKENTAVVLYGKEDIRLEVWPLPQKLEANGKCLSTYFLFDSQFLYFTFSQL